MTPPPIRVLLADDSPSVCRVLAAHLGPAAGFEVVGVAHSGEAATELVAATRPQVVTLDLEMPGIGGLAALDWIMAHRPTPVVLLTGVTGGAARQTVAALARGAVDFLPKYSPGRDPDPAAFAAEVAAKVRAAAGVRVIRSLSQRAGPPPAPCARGAPPVAVVVGASTGGPAAVREFLAALPPQFEAGVLVVQHLPAEFTRDLAALLARQTGLDVREAADGARIRPRAVLVAHGGAHSSVAPGGVVRLTRGPRVRGYRPSIDVAMESAVRAFGPAAAGVLLTGMGDDGVRGLAAIRAAGGRTFAQDEGSSVVFGMPQRAAEVGAAGEVDTPAGIAARLGSPR
ncbi:chemotaxis-specific protein-glutamate methyltransferase CheB [Gemmata sp.]|uniref:chemotaxis-specific protein-glutamate methyltransferase CheB n=1 Tax=Gemmata sp. TaxID=1914242 RepID=UPI003F702542